MSVLLSASMIVLGPVPQAVACSCAPIEDVRGEVIGADGAFVGSVLSREVRGHRATLEFQVTHAIKGPLEDTVLVETERDCSACGIHPPRGREIGLLLFGGSDGWESNLCAEVDPEALLAAGRSLPEPPRSAEPAGASVPYLWILIGASLLVSATTLIVRRRGPRHDDGAAG